MRNKRKLTFATLLCCGLVGAFVATYRVASAHCDTLRGPVVIAAKVAIAKGDVTQALWWVQAKDEPEIRAAFDKTLATRRASPAARDLADRYFFETLVRVHRMGEGEPYTGIKPEGTPVEHVIEGADAALDARSVDKLADAIAWKVKQGIKHRFAEALEKKGQAGRSVEAGREYVAAYVTYVHYVEAADATASGPAGHGLHGEEGH